MQTDDSDFEDVGNSYKKNTRTTCMHLARTDMHSDVQARAQLLLTPSVATALLSLFMSPNLVRDRAHLFYVYRSIKYIIFYSPNYVEASWLLPTADPGRIPATH